MNVLWLIYTEDLYNECITETHIGFVQALKQL